MEVAEIAEIARKHAVMVRIQGPDPKGLKMKRHPFHHHQDGKTTLSASGLLLSDSISGALGIIGKVPGSYNAVVVTISSVVEPFLRFRPNATKKLTSSKILLPELITETFIHVLIDQENKECILDESHANPCWARAQLLALVEVPASTIALRSIVGNHSSHENSSWDVGYAPLRNNPHSATAGLQDEVSSRKPIATTVAILGIMEVDIKESPHLDISQQQRQKRGDPLLVMGSPFGILSPLHFFNSIFVGSVANCMPTNSSQISLLMADIRCLPGTEGAPVFDKHAHLCGVLARPLRQKGSGAEIQLVITWNAIENAFDLVQCEPHNASEKWHGNNLHGPWKTQSPVERAISSVVLITASNGSWASGILLNTRGLVLTNAHLLEPWRYGRTRLMNEICNDKCSVVQEKKLSSSMSYRHYDKLRIRLNHLKPWIWSDARVVYVSKGPIDVALLQLDCVPDELRPMTVYASSPSPGHHVHVIGHANFGAWSDALPRVSSGVVSKVVSGKRCPELDTPEKEEIVPVMLETTAPVYSGMSGGAVVNSNGHMIGLVTSNARHGGGAIIPELNFSIPIAALEPVFRFLVEEDISVLHVLDKKDTFLSSVWALQSPAPLLEKEKVREEKGSRFSEFLAKQRDMKDLKNQQPSNRAISSKL